MKKQHKQARAVLYYGALLFFLAVFVFSAVYIGSYLINSKRSADEYQDLRQNMADNWASRPVPTIPKDPVPGPTEGSSPVLPTEPAGPTMPPEPTEPTEPSILPEYSPIYEMNSDTVGWIHIPNTKIDYPVLQTPEKPDFYLKHRFDKSWSDWGAIYVREFCDVFAPSDNVVIYGHHMRDGSMFAGLDAYKNRTFWQDNSYFYFDTLYERHTYQVFAAFKTSAYNEDGFPYHRFNDAVTPSDFDDFVTNVKKLSFYDTGITPKYGDKLVTLSTCEYTLSNGRFVVVAVRVA